MSLLLLLIVPLFLPLLTRYIWRHEITWAEFGINIAAGVLFVMAGYGVSMWQSTADIEVWNGQVVSKSRDRVSCRHSYSCNCRESCSGSGSSRSCTTTCDTCYEHSHDWDYVVKSDIGRFEIDRIDRQGRHEPPRFARVQIGDPVAMTHYFTNYIKAAPDSLFNHLESQMLLETYEGKLPDYPSSVYDYHYVNRVIASGVSIPDLAKWNQHLALTLRTLGVQRQANVVVVFTKEESAISEAISAKWLGGKKNDVIVVIGAKNFPAPDWVRVISWTDNELFKVHLRQGIEELSELTPETFMPVLTKHVMAEFQRKNWADFDYLKPEPPFWVLCLLFFGSLVVSMGCAIYLSRNGERPGGPGRGLSWSPRPYRSRKGW